MKKHTSFPKIPQYKNVLTQIKHDIRYVGQDEQGNPIYDETKELPTVTFIGTVKLHGTNASVCYNKEHGMWAQSRSNIVTVKNDNFGFAAFVERNKEVFQEMFDKEFILEDNHTACIYGEWAGKGIQSGVAISKLDKSFFIFAVKIKDHVKNESYYLSDPSTFKSPEHRIYNIYDFGTYEVEVDLNHPKDPINKFIELTEKIEQECPVAKVFGHSGVGEGIVWSVQLEGRYGLHYRFKTKGEKHSVTKVKKLVQVDEEKLNSVKDFVEYAVTENRVLQGMQETGANDRKDTGTLMRWIINDILTEEVSALVENGLEAKDVTKQLADAARKIFFRKIM